MNPSFSDAIAPVPSPFTTTHWSVVFEAGSEGGPAAAAALEQLCKAYWPPLYVFVRRSGYNRTDAEDLTQAFFEHLLSEQRLVQADPARGRFRTFLLSSLKHFLVNDWRRARRLKRGAGAQHLSFNCDPEEALYAREPATIESPDRIYEWRWATRLLEQALESLGQDYQRAGQNNLFCKIRELVWGDGSDISYASIAAALGLSQGALKVAIHRLRIRFRKRVRDAVAATLPDPKNPDDIEEELGYLQEVLRRGPGDSGVA
jgi:RNA polymerase sigma factor (sigma-70 family)